MAVHNFCVETNNADRNQANSSFWMDIFEDPNLKSGDIWALCEDNFCKGYRIDGQDFGIWHFKSSTLSGLEKNKKMVRTI